MSETPAPKRAYRSPLREEQAARTRERIVEAAAVLFSSQGFGGTTMGAIAQEAEVSVESVHATGSKASLLVEAFRARYAGRGRWDSILEQDVARTMFTIEDAAAALDAMEQLLVTAHAASADLMLQLRSTAAVEPLVAESWDAQVRSSSDGFVETARWMVRIGVVETPVDEADLPALAASLNVIMSSETYLQLTRDWGMDEAAYRSTMRRWLRSARP